MANNFLSPSLHIMMDKREKPESRQHDQHAFAELDYRDHS